MATMEAAEFTPSISAKFDEAQTREESLASSAATTALLLLPGVLTVALSFKSGSFFPGTTALAAVLLAVAAICSLIFVRHPFAGVSPWGLVAAGALGLFAGWTLLSSHWSHAPGRAVLSYDRVLIYLLAFTIYASIRRTERRMRVLLYGLATGCVVVCTASLISRMLPHVLAPTLGYGAERLSYPLTYWNTLGLLAGVGLIFCGHLASSTQEPRLARVVGAGAAPLLATTLFLTLSRGGAWATLMGVIAYLVVARPTGALLAGLATLPPWVFALVTVNPPSALTSAPYAPETIARGQHQAFVLVVCALVAAGVRAALLPLDDRLARFTLKRRTKRGIVVVGIAVIGIGALTFTASGMASRTVTETINQFQGAGLPAAGGANRLFSLNSDGRIDIWRVAAREFSASPRHGTGAGTFAVDWLQHRSGPMNVLNAHSLYLETLAELGLVGMALLGIALVAILIGLGRLARGSARGLYGAAFAAVVAWVLANMVDWAWQMPAVTLWVFAVGGLALASPATARIRLPRLRDWMRFPALVAAALLIITPLAVVQAEARINQAVAAADVGQCRAATSDAQLAQSEAATRSASGLIAAYCAVQTRRPDTAIAPLDAAIAGDPNNWQLWYDLAVVRARAGLSMRVAALTANRLDPLDPNVQNAVSAFSVLGPAGVHKQRALAARLTRHLRMQLRLQALTSRTPEQEHTFTALENTTPYEAEQLRGFAVDRQKAWAELTPLAP